ncbi:GspE/PulE family protein [Patescibacteria group bacterium]
MPSEKLQQLQDAILAGNIPQLVLNTISYALDSRSSDIHIEPLEHTVRVRYRIDGVLRQIVEYPTNIHPAVASRVKIMSNLKIDEQRIPQDGRSSVSTRDGREMDLRISTLPTVNGEKIVMRIQDKSRKIPNLDKLGLEGNSLKFIADSIKQPNGIILNTGPTGSGKTTTLYSILSDLNKPEVNILTIEDPVEIQMDGLNQSQVHPDINYTFAFGMRTGLRQDPDIIMVGEIRDKETVDTAIEASLTGHLVFSTIHTNSAVETLTRIDNMGVQPFLMASSIECIIAQRLVRKICEHCRVEEEVDPHLLEHVKLVSGKIHKSEGVDPALLQGLKFYRGQGCEKCDNVGYSGRVGLYEVMKMNNELRRAVLKRTSALEIEDIAIRTGMITLEQSGIIKALKGETSLNEVYRVARKMEDADVRTASEPPAEQAPAEPEPQPEPEPEQNPVNQLIAEAGVPGEPAKPKPQAGVPGEPANPEQPTT